MPSLEERLAEKRFRGGINYSLARLIGPLEALGNPHLQVPPTIHVAGTNGKGSTVALMGSLLRLMGYTVFSFTSPHLQSYSERFSVGAGVGSLPQKVPELVEGPGGTMLSTQTLSELLTEVESKTKSFDCTEFELLTLMCFLHVSRSNYDFLILETGLGGRLDATNVVTPILSIITRIDLDHQDFLGDSLEKIASEKAGIIKPKCPVVIAAQNSVAQRVLEAKAKSVEAPYYSCDPLPRFDTTTPDFQLENLALVMKSGLVLKQLGVALGMLPEPRGVYSSRALKGRFQIEETSGSHIVRDVAHNALGFKTTFGEYQRRFPDRRPTVIVGLNRSRDPKLLLELCFDFSDKVLYAKPDHELLWSYNEIVLLEPRLNAISLKESLPSGDYLILGSFYLMSL